MDTRVRTALVVVERQFREGVRERDLAAALGLSLSRFRHLFRRDTGGSFRRHLKSVPLSHAAQAMADPKLSVKEIALNSGYRNPANFTRAFAREYGATPQEFRGWYLRKGSRIG
jgi:AraC family transcriptional regulator of arabinose operon